MRDWFDISYLQHGTERQQAAYEAINQLGVLTALSDYTPVLVGTIPLDIDVVSSDLDIIHYAPDLATFSEAVWLLYGEAANFVDRRRTFNGVESYVANFKAYGFKFELFAQNKPVTQQNAYVHMMVEYRLLQLGGEDARTAIRDLKKSGIKTEPAFAQYFGIGGEPYQALLDLAPLDDEALRAIIEQGSA